MNTKTDNKRPRQAAFLLVKTDLSAYRVASVLAQEKTVVWTHPVFGPYQVVAYLQADSPVELAHTIEDIRTRRFIKELDARKVKIIPGDEKLPPLSVSKAEKAVLLINVNYKEEKERVVTMNLRTIPGVRLARAMWGPTDIIAIVDAADHETMRNLICDQVKTLKGVKENSTLYCYPSAA